MKVFDGIIINSDGTNFDPPIHPEMHKIEEKYPMCKSWGYNCMYCDKCPLGQYFKPSDEEEERILRERKELINKYILEHNPDMKEILERNKR